MTHKYKNKEYEVQTGAKGGQFFIDDSGKKHYIKSALTAKTKTVKEEEKVKKPFTYICYYEERIDGKLVDDFKEWCEAYSYDEAKAEFEDRYRHNSNVSIAMITR